jgi:hypothetical protein
MNNKVKPALIGGVILGLLSVIPFVNWVNVCCCLWAIVGGLIGSYLYVKNSPTPASAADGAVVGALAGLIGAIISLVIGIPINLLMGNVMAGLLTGMFENMNPEQAEMMRKQIEAGQTVPGAIVNGLITAVLLFIFAIIGGLIGIPLFEKRKGNVMPPPPPSTGGGPVGYTG